MHMNSLSREMLLSVDDDDVCARKTVMNGEPAGEGPLTAAGLLSVDDGVDMPAVSGERAWVENDESPVAAEKPAAPAPEEGSGTEVIRSYKVGTLCTAQVLWDRAAGQYRYELIEPRLTAAEKEAYEYIIAELHKKPRSELAMMRRIGGRERILRKFDQLCTSRGVRGASRDRLLYYIERDFWGYKKIHALLQDRNVEDVSCNGYYQPVYVYLPEFESIPSNVTFTSEEELDDFVMYLVQRGGKSISAARPIQDVALPDGSRLNATLYREVSSGGTTFSIRLANRARSAAELIRHGTFSPEALAFLWLAMENRCSTAFIGGTASGKTAALNAVAAFIVDRNKVVTIEDTREVRLSSRNWTALVTRETGESPITEFDLLVTAFRQRPEYVIVGEVRTPEGARTAIHGINSGHTVLLTFHADSARGFFNRLTHEPFSISPYVAASLSICVSLSMVVLPSGGGETRARRCLAISEVAGVEDDRLQINTVFEWDPGTDSVQMRPARSAVLERIREYRGWSEEQLIAEIAERAAVLRWLARNSVSGDDGVRKVAEAFRRNRRRLLDYISAHPAAGGDTSDVLP
ncbi:type II/IV secretion system ATPase subunit [Methanocella arvoryzae]|uniref:Bacterial type II secretion system protein n=1 Tax=Methanocella arvoryzae (strain DSM 22066 / NBRC 105507 / MRE50) TaxID=351160 RepID=Q0W6F3_METAR|nr:ATPase, T2SS/T4P/T4SS family [Methanocella arvoryzae]CAJ36040.1 putative bacterial type II secretion system protein [Methanocella arvoryzae MRE50]